MPSLMNTIQALILLLLTACMANAQGCVPEQLHLSLGEKYYDGPRISPTVGGGNQDLAKIIWVTHDPCDSAYLLLSLANQTGNETKLTPKVDRFEINVTNSIIEGTETKAETRDYVRYSNIVELLDSHIEPETLYLIKVVSPDTTTDPLSLKFKIPSPTPTNYPLNILFYADVDAGNSQKNVSSSTYTRLKQELASDDCEYNLTLLSGDIAYNLETNFGQNGDDFLKAWQPLMSTRPLMITPGNHDEYGNYSLLNYRFKMPLFEQTQNHYYSFNAGPVHFLSFDLDFYEDDIDFQSQEMMFRWVEKDLELANSPENKSLRPWIIVFTHRPIYCSYSALDDKPLNRCYNFYENRTEWDEIFSKYNVDMFISGHVHSYERMGPISANKSQKYDSSVDINGVQIIKNPTAPIYILDGSPGNEYFMPEQTYEPLPYSIKTDIKVGFSSLSVYNDSIIYMKHINSEDGSIIDHFYLHVDRSLIPSPQNPYLIALAVIASLLAVIGVGAAIYLAVKRSKSTKDNLVIDHETSLQDTSHFEKEVENRGV